MQLQRICDDTLRWLILFSLDLMRLLVASLFAAFFEACAQRPIPEGDVFTLYGDRHTMSDADFERALEVVREDAIKRYGAQAPITQVYVADHNHITVRHWPKHIERWASVERIHGRWAITKRSNHTLQPTTGPFRRLTFR